MYNERRTDHDLSKICSLYGEKSFSCVIGTMSVTILSSEDLEMIEFVIKYDSSMPATSLDVEADEEQRIAKRLVNYLYDLFPNLEKSIDKFLTEF